MDPVVHILVTCRNPELFRASTLVFDTIRTGFPTWDIYATGLDLSDEHESEIARLCRKTNIQFGSGRGLHRDHPDWIAELIQFEPKPFLIVDTDVIFWDSMEQFDFKGPLHGRYTGRFRCPLTTTITLDRLHTCVLYVDPAQVNARILAVNNRLQSGSNPFFRRMGGVQPINFAQNGEIYFHDSMGQAYHAIGGNKFSEEILNCFDHLGAATYIDLLDKKIPGARARQEVLLKDPKKARGLWKQQRKWEIANAA
jgi:hypothetical protein